MIDVPLCVPLICPVSLHFPEMYCLSANNERFYHGVIRVVKLFHRFIPASLGIDEKRKRLMVVGGALPGIPTLLYFTIVDFIEKDIPGVISDAGLIVLLTGSLVALSRIRNGLMVYRIMMAGFAALLLYNLYIGPSGQSSLVWMFIYPITVFYILGITEGIGWFGVLLVLTVPPLVFPRFFGTYHYPHEMQIRFIFALMLVAALSLVFELLRWYFYTKLEEQRSELKDALENVHTLSGLLPICSICKKIRDDHGYWNQLEEYLAEHTDARFSHGMCEDCLAEHYPDIHAKRVAKRLSGEKNPAGTTGSE